MDLYEGELINLIKPNQTHLNKLINVYRITKSIGRGGLFFRVGAELCRNGLSRTDLAYPWPS